MVSYLVLDVDGTLTDSGVYYDSMGNELKKFSTKDGAGFDIAHAAGIQLIVLTGRECEATSRRMQELKVDILAQHIRDKAIWLKEYMTANNLTGDEVGYIGDDLNDIPAMKLCGFVGCPTDSCKEVKALADYVSPVRGGHGAVRDCIEHLLTESGQWESAVKKAFDSQEL